MGFGRGLGLCGVEMCARNVRRSEDSMMIIRCRGKYAVIDFATKGLGICFLVFAFEALF